jgi:hypothetical protein
LIGWWLDQKFHTQFWVLILGLLGVFGGFREMFHLLKNLQPAQYERTPPPGRDKIVSKPPPVVKAPDTSPKPRLFSVPPPPFMEEADKTQRPSPQSADDVLRELLGEDREASEKSPDKTE